MHERIILFTLQGFAGIISLAVAFVVAGVVAFLIVNSRKSEGAIYEKSKVLKIRGRYFWLLIVSLIIILFASIRLLPYSRFQGEADEVVTVVGLQWDWKMAHGLSDQKPEKFTGKTNISLPVNKRIKFIITSSDVTHNFGLYTKSGVLLTQIEVLPGYKSELQYVFKKKGNYTVLCLEYCGLAHPFMTAIIHVY